MQLHKLDHVNVRTANLETMMAWYTDVLGMPSGYRPDFGFPGAWMYLADDPIIHLVGIDEDPEVSDMRLEHFAFSASGLPALIDRLKAKGLDYKVGRVDDVGIIQINVWDPDGNHIHIDFQASEAEGLDL